MLKSESPLLLPLYARLATDEDLDVIVKLINDALAKDTYPFKGKYRTDQEEIVRYLETGYFLLFELDNDLVGIIYAELRSQQRGYLGMLTVNPEMQGLGIGQQIRRAGEEFCREHGCRVVEGVTPSFKRDLTASHQRAGYRIVGEVPYERPELLVQPASLFQIEKDLFPIA
jgi:GNAT superfamily N-acetyltransferase